MVEQSELEAASFSLRPIIRAVMQDIRLLVLFVLAACAVATAYLLVVKPQYRTEAVMIAAGGAGELNVSGLLGQLGGLASTFGLPFQAGDSRADEALALMDSDGFLRDFITRHRLFPMLRESPYRIQPLAFLRPAEKGEPDLRRAVKVLRRLVSVRRDRITSVITISVQWHDRAAAARLLQQLIDDVNNALRAGDVEESQRAIAVLTDEVNATDVGELRQSMYRLIELQMNKLTVAKVRRDYAIKFIGPVYVPSPSEKVWPRTMLVLAIAVLLGGAAGLSLIWLRKSGH